jgi:FixJ family two-component response regulator
MKLLYKIGAQDYIRKPENFNLLKQVIQTSLSKIQNAQSVDKS